MEMQSYQIRGILEHQLTLAQAGIGIYDNNFIQQDPEDLYFSEKTVNALEVIKAQNKEISHQEAYNIAIKLSLHQIIGMSDFGLSMEQVNTQQYKDLGDSIRVELTEKILNHEIEIDFPLSEKQQEIARKEFNKILRKREENKEVQETTPKLPDLSYFSSPKSQAKNIKISPVNSNHYRKRKDTIGTTNKQLQRKKPKL